MGRLFPFARNDRGLHQRRFSARRAIARAAPEMDDDDRISKLPDAVLCKILSCLDIRLAIRTCILSKRWKPLWTFLVDFDFDFDINRSEIRSNSEKLDYSHPFTRFVCRVLSKRDQSLKIGKFRLAFNVEVDRFFIKRCIRYAARHNVEELDLSFFHNDRPLRFPNNFLESESLHTLRLKFFDRSIIIPKPFCFPNLKKLQLEQFAFKDDDDFCFAQEPFSAYPNLEELTLYGCIVDGLTILAPELKLLEFIDSEPHLSYESVILKAEMPKLESFVFVSQVSLVCPMDELLCLDTVYVDLRAFLIGPDTDTAFPIEPDIDAEPEPNTDEVKEKMPINLFKLLEQLKNARSLAITCNTVEVLSMDSSLIKQHPSPFVNLKHLEFICLSEETRSSLLFQDVMAYLTKASSFRDSMTVEYS